MTRPGSFPYPTNVHSVYRIPGTCLYTCIGFVTLPVAFRTLPPNKNRPLENRFLYTLYPSLWLSVPSRRNFEGTLRNSEGPSEKKFFGRENRSQNGSNCPMRGIPGNLRAIWRAIAMCGALCGAPVPPRCTPYTWFLQAKSEKRQSGTKSHGSGHKVTSHPPLALGTPFGRSGLPSGLRPSGSPDLPQGSLGLWREGGK